VLSLHSGDVTADEAELKAPTAKQAKCDQSIEVSRLSVVLTTSTFNLNFHMETRE